MISFQSLYLNLLENSFYRDSIASFPPGGNFVKKSITAGRFLSNLLFYGENARRSKLALMDVGIEEDLTFNTESECHA